LMEQSVGEKLVRSMNTDYYKIGEWIEIRLPKDKAEAAAQWTKVKRVMDILLDNPSQP
jgi:hypothetical protein